jgi:hypothetical protein
MQASLQRVCEGKSAVHLLVFMKPENKKLGLSPYGDISSLALMQASLQRTWEEISPHCSIATFNYIISVNN